MVKVSVIIPVYNVEQYLRQCLDSVLNQTLKDIETICVDDGSTDNSLAILNEYKQKDNRVQVIQQQNQYAGVARNNGVKVAKGKYIIFLDSDDFFELDMLEGMYNRAEKDNADVTICGWKAFNDMTQEVIKHHKINDRYLRLSPFKPYEVSDELFEICKPNPWTKLVNREFFTFNHLQFENCICCNDLTCVCLQLALARKISVVEECYVYYRIRQNDNLTSNRNKNFSSVIYAINALEKGLKERCLYNTLKTTFIRKAVVSLNCGKDLCSPKELEERKEISRKDLSDELYRLTYKESKIKPRANNICHDKFF